MTSTIRLDGIRGRARPDATIESPRLAPERVERWQAARRLLAVRLDNLGDVLMTTPALAALGADPRREVTLLTSRAGAAVAGHLPRLDDLIVHDAAWVRGPSGSGADDRRFVARLARRRFDAAVIFTVCTQSALPAAFLLRLAGIPLRLAHSRENPYALLTDRLPETDTIGPGMRHEVRRQLDLVGAAGFDAPADEGLAFEPTGAEIASVRARLAAAGVAPGRPYVVVHPGSSAPSRRYPPERFGIAAGLVAARTRAAVVFAGGPDERGACDAAIAALRATAPAAGGPAAGPDEASGTAATRGVTLGSGSGATVVSLAGELSLGELAALIGDARLCLCNNSGPAHLAAARRTPVVVAYALTNPQHTPWGVPTRVLSHPVPCRDCLRSVCPEGHHLCLLGIAPERLADAAVELWRETEPGSGAAAGRATAPAPVAPTCRPPAPVAVGATPVQASPGPTA